MGGKVWAWCVCGLRHQAWKNTALLLVNSMGKLLCFFFDFLLPSVLLNFSIEDDYG